MIASKLSIETPSPSISEQSVKAALDRLLEDRCSTQSNPLETLLLIDYALLNTFLPGGASNRSYVLSCVLTSIISDELLKCRYAMGVKTPLDETSLEQAQKAIKEDAKFSNPVLLGWSWLYFHYVRQELNISVAHFSQLAVMDERTLLRYRQHAIRRLMFHLITREEVVRRKIQKRQLYAQLPRACTPLFGRDTELNCFEDWLQGRKPISLQVIGARGVGKTAFVQEALRLLIESDSIEFLFWFDRPTSVRVIWQRLSAFIEEQALCSSVREFVQCRRIAVIIDGIDTFSNELERLEDLLDELEYATVFLTSHVPISIRSTTGHIVLPELEQSDAVRFIRSLIDKWHFRYFEQLNNNDLETIWGEARGNPRLIEKAVWNLQAQRVSGYSSERLLAPFP